LKGEILYGIEVRESGAGMLVELWGEFDLFSLTRLREALNGVASLQRPTLVDLSGITFLDLLSARELALRSQLYSHYLTFGNPSPEVTASARAFGLEGWARFHARADRREPPVISEVS
jgi:anti-anti-sigma regulatory factor